MDNQHKKIKGYRDLSEAEIDLMNRIKDHAENTRLLLKTVKEMRLDESAELGHKSGILLRLAVTRKSWITTF